MRDEGLIERANAFAQVVVEDMTAPELQASDRHHFLKVLRLRNGAQLAATDGAGNWCMTNWTGVSLEVAGSVQKVDPGPEVAIGFSPLKGDRTELAVQKATELGARRIVLLTNADHAVVRWDAQRKAKVLSRLSRIAREAVMQSRRVWLPSVEDMTFQDALEQGATIADMGALDTARSHPFVLVGPEGGWSDRERSLVTAGAVSLGDAVLRAETAVIAAVTMQRG